MITSSMVPHKRSDLIIVNFLQKICTIIEFSCPSDINIFNKIHAKVNNYAPLLRIL